MRPDVLFWFYKEFAVCAERLRLLRALNPSARIYGLYGGPLDEAPEAERRLGGLIDDFHVFAEARDARWKWRHGDRMIAAWYRDRGRDLPWETLFVHQWDALAAAPLGEIFAPLQPGELFLSGYRPLAEVTAWWPWVDGSRPDERRDFEAFRAALAADFGYAGPLHACLFIVTCLPRTFLDRYAGPETPAAGFLEYKIPSMATVFGVPVRTDSAMEPWWAADPRTKQAPAETRALNAVGHEVAPELIARELLRPQGRRLFHPVGQRLPVALFDQISPGAEAGACPRLAPSASPI